MEQDRLSNLPKIILHDILSRLPEKDAARTSVLSKVWAQTWSTFPILSFSDAKIVGWSPHYPLGSRKIKEFLENVDRTLLRFRNQGLAIEQFELRVNSFDLYHMSIYVDLWLKLAIESGARVLKLRSLCFQCQQRYIFPTSILEAKSLTKLVLKGRIKVDLSLINHSTKIFSLQALEFEKVLLEDEHALKHFISCCPLIEYITLRWCPCRDDNGRLHFLEALSMCGLPKLKGVYVYGMHGVYVDSPCLENLHYGTSSRLLETIDFNKCKNLRELFLQSLRSTIITNKWLLDLFANFPFLESLKLEDCAISERIDISSVRLKTLKLERCSGLKEVNIDAPNLLSCVYAYRRRASKSISFSRYSSQLKVNVRIEIYNIDFQKIREFIQNIRPKFVLESISLSIDIRWPMPAWNPAVLPVSSPPPSIKDLVLLDTPRYEAMFMPIVYGILSFCCPATISIYFGSCRAFVEFFYETLKGEHVDSCFCNAGNSKCWWHDLKDVKVTSTMNTDENVAFKTMLDMFFSVTSFSDNICFRLEF